MLIRQGQVDDSIEYLQTFIRVSEDSKDDTALSHACNSLGIRLNYVVCIGPWRLILVMGFIVANQGIELVGPFEE